MTKKHYAERDICSPKLRGLYAQHVNAMTAEKLHSKSDIAAELAWRDAQIRDLRAWQRTMIDKAAQSDLAGYRKLGQAAAAAEQRADDLERRIFAMKDAWERVDAHEVSVVEKLEELVGLLYRPASSLPSDDVTTEDNDDGTS